MSIIQTALRADEYVALTSDFQLDLEAAFLVMREAAMQHLAKYASGEWTLDQLMAELDMERLTIQTPAMKTLEPKGTEGGRGILGKLDRLKERFGWNGGSVGDLFKKIFRRNTEDTGKAAAEITRSQFAAGGKKLVLPETNDILLRSKLDILKAGVRGKNVSEYLRKKLQTEVRAVLADRNLIQTRGPNAGRISEAGIEQIRQRWAATLDGYTNRDPRYGAPRDVASTVNTEVRRIVNQTRQAAAETYQEKNEVELLKSWRHNPQLSKVEPRANHRAMNGQTVPMKERFRLTAALGGVFFPLTPHDGELPVEEVVNCHCDMVFTVAKRNE